MKIKLFLLIFSCAIIFGCAKDDSTNNDTKLSNENKITSFIINASGQNYSGNINHSTKLISLETIGLEQSTSVAPEINISPKATIFPNPSIPQNFNEPIEYTVIAENGDQVTYITSTNNTVFSNEKKILTFQFDIDGEIFEGDINHNELSINIDCFKYINNISPLISISEDATISPSASDFQNFTNDVEYTVTAKDGSYNTYKVITNWFTIGTLNSAYNTSNIATKYYSNAEPYVRTTFVDLNVPNSKIVLENATNSYELDYSKYESYLYEGILNTSFQVVFPEGIITASDYKLKYKVDNIVKAETNFSIDILAENVPQILSSNQNTYKRNDTLILYGTDLVPGLRVVTFDGYTYQYNSSYVSVNNDKTELTLPLTINGSMFPSYHGQSEDQPTPIVIYYDGRYGDVIVVDFD